MTSDSREKALSSEEFERAWNLAGPERLAFTVNMIRETGTIWCLYSESEPNDGWCTGLDPGEERVLPIWPHREFASRSISGAWRDSHVESVSLERFFGTAHESIQRDEMLLAVFPNEHEWVSVPFSDFKAHVSGPEQDRYAPLPRRTGAA